MFEILFFFNLDFQQFLSTLFYDAGRTY